MCDDTWLLSDGRGRSGKVVKTGASIISCGLLSRCSPRPCWWWWSGRKSPSSSCTSPVCCWRCHCPTPGQRPPGGNHSNAFSEKTPLNPPRRAKTQDNITFEEEESSSSSDGEQLCRKRESFGQATPARYFPGCFSHSLSWMITLPLWLSHSCTHEDTHLPQVLGLLYGLVQERHLQLGISERSFQVRLESSGVVIQVLHDVLLALGLPRR